MDKIVSKFISNGLFFQQVRTYLNEGKQVQFSLRGSSMSPFLYEGDLVTVKSLENTELKVGHIVLAYAEIGYVMHRIIRIDSQLIYLAGDANFVQIEKIANNALIAFLTAATRDGREIPIYASHILWLARMWYYARPIRRIWAKACKSLRK